MLIKETIQIQPIYAMFKENKQNIMEWIWISLKRDYSFIVNHLV